MEKEVFMKRLKDVISRYGTGIQFARIFGFSYAAIGRWLDGTRSPVGLYKDRLEKIFDAKTEIFYSGKKMEDIGDKFYGDIGFVEGKEIKIIYDMYEITKVIIDPNNGDRRIYIELIV